ncbi:hypothetical protein FNV43_RR00598 [Rhamnella rubrinervis]|uniref:Uncharacterized protein n=1 Tax=Rhamnella rubrinervis TaxID=2594499 RepID=A0A8K0HQP7_9ROSA|nr:hypothetical protein FNV43_RR00598 [Rhamnella rubrinervis]
MTNGKTATSLSKGGLSRPCTPQSGIRHWKRGIKFSLLKLFRDFRSNRLCTCTESESRGSPNKRTDPDTLQTKTKSLLYTFKKTLSGSGLRNFCQANQKRRTLCQKKFTKVSSSYTQVPYLHILEGCIRRVNLGFLPARYGQAKDEDMEAKKKKKDKQCRSGSVLRRIKARPTRASLLSDSPAPQREMTIWAWRQNALKVTNTTLLFLDPLHKVLTWNVNSHSNARYLYDVAIKVDKAFRRRPSLHQCRGETKRLKKTTSTQTNRAGGHQTKPKATWRVVRGTKSRSRRIEAPTHYQVSGGARRVARWPRAKSTLQEGVPSTPSSKHQRHDRGVGGDGRLGPQPDEDGGEDMEITSGKDEPG